jgi:DNA protecting protein DprA
LRRNKIRLLFYTEPEYPQRLAKITEAPALLFYQGSANLNADKIIAIAGTRTPTKYGRQMAVNLIRDLAQPNLIILSGLAFGIDAIAHRAALDCNLPTVGVLGHGPDNIYPAEHTALSQSMCKQGGLLTSFPPGTSPEPFTFPMRNKLIAGCCDALIVIESTTGGGSMSTAKAASEFGKTLFAIPGRIIDPKSEGCLQLIGEQRAVPLLSAKHLNAVMGWAWDANAATSYQPALPFDSTHPAPQSLQPNSRLQQNPQPDQKRHQHPTLQPASDLQHESDPDPQPQPEPYPQPDTLEYDLLALLKEKPNLSFEDLIRVTGKPIPALSYAILNLEINGSIRSIPGKRYTLLR